MESILRVLTSNADIYINLKKDPNDFTEFTNSTKEILQNAFKIETNLHLSTKEAFSLEEIIEIISAFNKCQIDTDEDIEKIIKYSNDQIPLIIHVEKNEYDQEELVEHFENFYKYLEDTIGKSEIYPKMISIIIQDEYLKISNKYFRKKLIEKMTSDNKLAYNCYPLLKRIIKGINISIQPKTFEGNLKMLLEKKDALINVLNEKSSKDLEFLEQAILQTFEHLLLKFFDNIEKINKNSDKTEKEKFVQLWQKKEKKEKNYEIYKLLDKSLDIFDECIMHLKNLIENKNQEKPKTSNLSKLYAIAFIKVYLTKFVENIDKYNDQEINMILEPINRDKNNLEKIIQIYTIKILFNFNNRNYQNLSKKDITRREEFSKILENYSQYFLLNYFLPCEKNDGKLFEKETNKINRKNFSSSDDKIENIDIFLSAAINKIISNLLIENYLRIGSESLEH